MVSFEISTNTLILIGSLILFIILIVVFTVLFSKLAAKKRAKKEEMPSHEELVSIAKDLLEKPKIIKEAKVANKKVKKEPEVKEPEIVEDIPLKPFDAIRHKKSKWSLKYWKAHFKDKFFPHKSILITMELTNGMFKQFIVLVKPDNTFKYRSKLYVVDNESKYYIIDSKIWGYDFHEDFTLPIKRSIPLTKIKKTLEHSNISEVEYATNPSTLERFTISKIAEGIMKGQQMDEVFKRMQLLLIITMVAAVAHLLIFMFKSGMLSQIKIPGIT